MLGLMLLLAPAALAQPTASINVTPGSGVAGTGLTISGSGWTPGDLLDVALDAQPVCRLKADGGGNISGTETHDDCRVPAGAAAGNDPVTAIGAPSGAQASGAPFYIPIAASFSAPSGPVAVNAEAMFDASAPSNGSPTNYLWEFGDGSFASGSADATTDHFYGQAGTYTVTLLTFDGSGDIAQSTHEVLVEEPVAAFNPTFATVLAGSAVAFDGTLSSDPGGITGYAWDFGDGSSSTSAQPSHTYLQTGTFNVRLTVTDASLNSSTITHQITVIAPPPVQTLILTPAANPTIVTWLPVFTNRAGTVDLGERLFCPGLGPPCIATITSTSSALARDARARRVARPRATTAGSRVLHIAPNSSSELAFKLSRAALVSLRAHNRLRVRLKVVVVRGNQTTTSVINLTLR